MEPRFPIPIYTAKRRRWRLSEVLDYERALAGLPPLQHDPAAERWLTAAQMRERFGASDMWLWRRTVGAERQHHKSRAGATTPEPSRCRFVPQSAAQGGLA